MMIYRFNDERGIADLAQPSYQKIFNTVTLGNLGGTETFCKTFRLASSPDEQDLKCPNGYKATFATKDKKGRELSPLTYDYGVMSAEVPQKTFCQEKHLGIYIKDQKEAGTTITDCS